jgi:putative tricarboxylic transport membrane protein
MESSNRIRDIAVGTIGMLIGLGLSYEAYGMSYPSKVFPLVVSLSIVTLCALIALLAIAFPGALSTKRASFLPSLRSFIVIATALIYVVMIQTVGFYVSSFICVLFLSVITETQPFNGRSLAKTAMATGVFLLGVYLIFSYLLRAPIPEGMIF